MRARPYGHIEENKAGATVVGASTAGPLRLQDGALPPAASRKASACPASTGCVGVPGLLCPVAGKPRGLAPRRKSHFRPLAGRGDRIGRVAQSSLDLFRYGMRLRPVSLSCPVFSFHCSTNLFFNSPFCRGKSANGIGKRGLRFRRSCRACLHRQPMFRR